MAAFDGLVALVTGAGSADGIGFAAAKILAEKGAHVAITSTTDRIETRLAEINAGEGGKFAVVADLTKERQVERLIERVVKRFGRIDVLVNNAGMIQSGEKAKASLVQKIGTDEWKRAIDINLNTCFYVTRAVLPLMLRRRYGRVVNIASVTGPLVTFDRSAAYSAAKAAMVGFTRAAAHEVGKHGITVNAVNPGPTDSTWMDEATRTALKPSFPFGRIGAPEDVARLIQFLVSPDGGWVTGQVIHSEGGFER